MSDLRDAVLLSDSRFVDIWSLRMPSPIRNGLLATGSIPLGTSNLNRSIYLCCYLCWMVVLGKIKAIK